MSSSKKTSIVVLPQGPYEVKQEVPLAIAATEIDAEETSRGWKKVRDLSPTNKDGVYHLCRCGHSSHKPFCDGTHHHVNFNGQETAPLDGYASRAELIEGETIDLLDDKSLCVYARFCDGAPRAWNATVESGKGNNREIAIQEAGNCPGGRLTVLTKDGTPIEPNYSEEIWVTQDTAANVRGPLWVKGGMQVTSSEGENYEVRNRIALCRCGESNNKPYCDASHMNCPHMKGHDE